MSASGRSRSADVEKFRIRFGDNRLKHLKAKGATDEQVSRIYQDFHSFWGGEPGVTKTEARKRAYVKNGF